ncbi:hypothetical protein HK098_002615 [Nowakowskiella sp. JEL0407]|nr:hypothetical protein HK098_002615 [Nowakowskiella sp. JEL0407]
MTMMAKKIVAHQDAQDILEIALESKYEHVRFRASKLVWTILCNSNKSKTKLNLTVHPSKLAQKVTELKDLEPSSVIFTLLFLKVCQASEDIVAAIIDLHLNGIGSLRDRKKMAISKLILKVLFVEARSTKRRKEALNVLIVDDGEEYSKIYRKSVFGCFRLREILDMGVLSTCSTNECFNLFKEFVDAEDETENDVGAIIENLQNRSDVQYWMVYRCGVHSLCAGRLALSHQCFEKSLAKIESDKSYYWMNFLCRFSEAHENVKFGIRNLAQRKLLESLNNSLLSLQKALVSLKALSRLDKPRKFQEEFLQLDILGTTLLANTVEISMLNVMDLNRLLAELAIQWENVAVQWEDLSYCYLDIDEQSISALELRYPISI